MADNRTKAQKLRALYNHPRTSQIERDAARLALDRLGAGIGEPTKTQPAYDYDTLRSWMKELLRAEAEKAAREAREAGRRRRLQNEDAAWHDVLEIRRRRENKEDR